MPQDAGITDVAGVPDLFKEMVSTVLEKDLRASWMRNLATESNRILVDAVSCRLVQQAAIRQQLIRRKKRINGGISCFQNIFMGIIMDAKDIDKLIRCRWLINHFLTHNLWYITIRMVNYMDIRKQNINEAGISYTLNGDYYIPDL